MLSSHFENVTDKLVAHSVGNHFFQSLAKMASGLKLLLAKMKKARVMMKQDTTGALQQSQIKWNDKNTSAAISYIYSRDR